MAKEYFPVVVQAVAGPERTVYAYFSDGKVTKYDMAPPIARGGGFFPASKVEVRRTLKCFASHGDC